MKQEDVIEVRKKTILLTRFPVLILVPEGMNVCSYLNIFFSMFDEYDYIVHASRVHLKEFMERAGKYWRRFDPVSWVVSYLPANVLFNLIALNIVKISA